MDSDESIRRFFLARFLFERSVASVQKSMALKINKMTVPGRVDSANDRRTDDSVVGSIQPLPLLATYGDMEDRSLFFLKKPEQGCPP